MWHWYPPPRLLLSPAEIASVLSQVEHVEMVKGDITNQESILKLIQGCDAVLCLQGPIRPNPFKYLFHFYKIQLIPDILT